MVGKEHRDTSFVTATPSTVTSSSAAFGRWAFGIGQPRRDRRGRTGIVKGRSVRSAGNVLTMLSCSASGIFAICCDLTRLARTFQSTRTRRRREQYIPLVAFCLRHFLADFIICMCEFDFRQAQPSEVVSAASPTRMQGQLETYTPRPGTGYYAHIRLEGSQAHFQNGQQHTFEIATPTARISATYHQPLTGSA